MSQLIAIVVIGGIWAFFGISQYNQREAYKEYYRKRAEECGIVGDSEGADRYVTMMSKVR